MSDRKSVSRTVLLGLFAVLIFGAGPAFSQQSSKPIRVGVLMSGFEPFYAGHDRGLVAGLRDRGYIEGKNLIIERRYGHLDGKRFSVLAQELVGMNLDAIVTVCTGTTRAAKGATNSTPIVMLSVPDPVGQGLATSLARPGANVTGRSSQHFDLVPKTLQMFHEAVPKAGQIAVLVNAPNPIHQEAWAEALAAARSLNVDLIRIEMQGAAGLDAALESVAKSNANALFVLPDDPPTFNLRPRIIAFARERALPLLAPYREVVEDGALMSYGESYEDAAQWIAWYVDRVVQGANPAELPIPPA
jgi:putative ABC transport system substrate-binding protein